MRRGKERFSKINDFLLDFPDIERSIRFPYGNKYGWSATYRKKKKLICDVFAESGAFTVMIRLTNKVLDGVYGQLHKSAQEQVDGRYPCGDGGWVHFRVVTDDDLEYALLLLSNKFRPRDSKINRRRHINMS